MTTLLAIAVGGALGALARYGLSVGVSASLGPNFPFGTLAVNLLGSVAMGICFVLFVERSGVSPELRLGIMTGFLGAFTTFSTFSLETLHLLDAGRLVAGIVNIIGSVVLCVLGCWGGISLARMSTS